MFTMKATKNRRCHRGEQIKKTACWSLLLMCCFLSGFTGLAATYYVDAGTGSDTNSGSSTSPFRTIQKAASLMGSGDICEIRTGIYRETIVPQANNVTFRAASGATPVISGGEAVTGWTVHSGKIYKASMGWNLGAGKNQVFAGGQMMLEARWPNTTSLDPMRPNMAVCDAGTTNVSSGATGTVVDAALPSVSLTGATLHIGSGHNWSAFTGTVTSQSSGSFNVSFHWPAPESWYRIREGNTYYLLGIMSLLDSPGEWVYDSGKLYLWAPGGVDPSSLAIEAKARQWGLDLSNRDSVRVEGLQFLACGITSNGSTSRCVLKNIKAKYVNHFTIIDFDRWGPGAATSGVLLQGSSNQIIDSEIAYSAGTSLALGGTGQLVQNCTVHDAGYAGSLGAPVRTLRNTSGHTITRSRIYNASRDCLMHDMTKRLTITYNDIYNSGLQFRDNGVTYAFGTDGGGSEIAYNLIHDNLSGDSAAGGLYLDNGCSNYDVHHNVIWGVFNGIILNTPSTYNKVYNNTVAIGYGNCLLTYIGTGGDSMTGTVIRNNLFYATGKILNGTNYTYNTNWRMDPDPQFVDFANHDFRLKSTSPCIDAGVNVGLTQDINGVVIPTGAGPDIGAYEFTTEPTGGTGPQPTAPAAPTGLKVIE